MYLFAFSNRCLYIYVYYFFVVDGTDTGVGGGGQSSGDASATGASVQRLVAGSCDTMVRVYRKVDGKWIMEKELQGHEDWVRDVAWAPQSAMLGRQTIASCGEDGNVFIWTKKGNSAEWTKTLLRKFASPVWRVSWSITGSVLAVSSGDHNVTLWKESLDRTWVQISSVSE